MNKMLTRLLAVCLTLTLAACVSTPQEQLNQNITLQEKGRYGHASVTDGDYIYTFGGSYGRELITHIAITDVKTGITNNIETNLLPRRYHTAVFDGKESVYLIGGVGLVNKKFILPREVEVFNTKTHKVTQIKPLPMPTRYNDSVIIDNKIYVIAGSFRRDGRVIYGSGTAVYDIASDTWEPRMHRRSRSETRAVAHQGKLYVVGGFSGNESNKAFERYNPESNLWTKLPSLPVAVSAHSIVSHKDKLIVFGDYYEEDRVYQYDTKTEHWSELTLDFQPSRHSSAVVIGDSVFVVGGNNNKKRQGISSIQRIDL